ncbi:MAG: Lysozyme (N-acetylmuramidase) family, (EC [uncultured Paraburkholderia sp.]|nr:MAG: Lysozyme (N-acetylmuramidase) family, (EC [uncultured Paraburkholderia sp.]CAH2790637.1 MAG: Lysozyme (N-acetylmuramidase) family, (EC [uncultured Paraburkholderia sp.]CAH2924753.1 MAG: Lysozyme (N-acetylmuramidase) family, (EC [uncultured Paraburkholderia sp.]CAH2927386.1 MAG: Lysozyme (N-acetylmuramidase) family, (EC [uncultured Paraburkholderia sp.]
MENFEDAFKALIGSEGGYSFNPADPGSETMWGVTARVARSHGYNGAMKDLPLDTARQIAKQKYWDPLHLDELDPRVAFQIFDANYNGGLVVLWMQKASGANEDGKFGPQTLEAVKNTDPMKFVMQFAAYRLRYLGNLHAWQSFSRGWTERMACNLLPGAA